MCFHLADATKQIISCFEGDTYTSEMNEKCCFMLHNGCFVEVSGQPYMYENKPLVCISPLSPPRQLNGIILSLVEYFMKTKSFLVIKYIWFELKLTFDQNWHYSSHKAIIPVKTTNLDLNLDLDLIMTLLTLTIGTISHSFYLIIATLFLIISSFMSHNCNFISHNCYMSYNCNCILQLLHYIS